MGRWRMGLMVIGLGLALGTGARAQSESSTMLWLYQQLGGNWQQDADTGSDGAAGMQRGRSTRGRTSFQYQGGGVFRVHSTEGGPLLGRWNGRQVRVSGPVNTDPQGWTYFQLNGVPTRIGQHQGGWKIVELNYGNNAERVELVQRR